MIDVRKLLLCATCPADNDSAESDHAANEVLLDLYRLDFGKKYLDITQCENPFGNENPLVGHYVVAGCPSNGSEKPCDAANEDGRADNNRQESQGLAKDYHSASCHACSKDYEPNRSPDYYRMQLRLMDDLLTE